MTQVDIFLKAVPAGFDIALCEPSVPCPTVAVTPTETTGGGLGRVLRPRLKRKPVFHDEETMLFDLV